METIRAWNTRYDSKVSKVPGLSAQEWGEWGHISEISAVIVTSEQKLTAGMQAMLSPSYLIPLFTQTFTILILCPRELIWRDCSRTNCLNANSPRALYISSDIDWNSVINNIDRPDYPEVTVIVVIGRLDSLLRICDCWSVFWCDDSMGHVSHAHPGGH